MNGSTEIIIFCVLYTMKSDKNWQILLLAVRLWLGYAMMHNGRFFFSLFSSAEDRKFFTEWFGKDLHFPLPLQMAFLAKGAEFFGGFLVFLGLFTRVGAFLISFTMMVATLTANLGKNFEVDGTITISYFLFGLVVLYGGSGRFGLDHLIRKNRFGKHANPSIHS
jgi:uncharacterized membrane protein YphA (DoxX/SURF4 family)